MKRNQLLSLINTLFNKLIFEFFNINLIFCLFPWLRYCLSKYGGFLNKIFDYSSTIDCVIKGSTFLSIYFWGDPSFHIHALITSRIKSVKIMIFFPFLHRYLSSLLTRLVFKKPLVVWICKIKIKPYHQHSTWIFGFRQDVS